MTEYLYGHTYLNRTLAHAAADGINTFLKSPHGENLFGSESKASVSKDDKIVIVSGGGEITKLGISR